MKRRDFLQGLGISLGALILPRQSSAAPTSIEQQLFFSRSESEPKGPMMYAFGADLDEGRRYNVDVELPHRMIVRGINTHVYAVAEEAQVPGALVIEKLGEPNILMGPIDAVAVSAYGAMYLPIDLPMMDVLPMQMEALQDVQLTTVLWLEGPMKPRDELTKELTKDGIPLPYGLK